MTSGSSLRWVALASLTLGLGACATVVPTRPVDDFAHKAMRWDIELYWNCVRPTPGLLQMEGVAISTYFPSPIQDLEFRLDGVDGRGANVSRAQGAARDYAIPMMAQSPFRLTLPTAGTEVRFDLAYSFLAQESGGMGNSSNSGERYSVVKDVCPGEKR